MPAMLEWAERYARAGWSIFPCSGKRPIMDALPRGADGRPTWEPYKRIRASDEQIKQWWTKYPDAQIALVCGRISGITVIDVDWVKDKNKNILIAESEDPADLRQKIPATMTSRSGSGGYHLFHTFADIPCSSGIIHKQIDVKSEGGCVILPPSQYDEAGRRYEWDDTLGFIPSLLTCLPPIPRNIVDWYAKEKAKEKTGRKAWGDVVSGVSVGRRNTTAAQMAGKLIRSFGRDTETAWDLFKLWNSRNSPPLERKELESVFRSILKAEYGKPGR